MELKEQIRLKQVEQIEAQKVLVTLNAELQQLNFDVQLENLKPQVAAQPIRVI